MDKLIIDSVYSRILGGNLKNNLSWDSHLLTGKKAVLPAVRKLVGLLHSIRHLLPTSAKLKIVNSLVIGKLSYIVSLWGNTNNTIMKKVQVTLNSAARLVLNKRKTTRQSTLMEGCKWLNVWELAEYHSLVQLFKVARWRRPTRLSNKFNTTDDGIIETPPHRLHLTSLAWRVNTTSQWNNLPTELRTQNNFKKFKNQLKTWLVDRREPYQEPPD